MGYNVEFNCLLTVPNDQLDLKTLKPGDKVTIYKDGARLYPVGIAIEICDKNTYTYYGKIVVHKQTLKVDTTVLEIEVLKVFSEEEAKVFTENFIKPKQ